MFSKNIYTYKTISSAALDMCRQKNRYLKIENPNTITIKGDKKLSKSILLRKKTKT